MTVDPFAVCLLLAFGGPMLAAVIHHIAAYQAYKDEVFPTLPKKPSPKGLSDAEYGKAMKEYEQACDDALYRSSCRKKYDNEVERGYWTAAVATITAYMFLIPLAVPLEV